MEKIPEYNIRLTTEANKLFNLPSFHGKIKKIVNYIENGRYFKAELALEKMKKENGVKDTYIFLRGLIKYKMKMRAGARKIMSVFEPDMVNDPQILESAGTLLAKIGMEK